MIGYLKGNVIFSDGSELVLLTQSGVGHQIYFYKIFPEGKELELYVTQVIKENSQELFGFPSLQEKKLFEILTTVKGIGPKSAYALMSTLGVDLIINSIRYEDKKSISKAPGIGPKAAAQIILDLGGKIEKIKMYSSQSLNCDQLQAKRIDSTATISFDNDIYSEAMMACTELGFTEDSVRPLALKILNENEVIKAEQLVHLVLKEM